MDFRELNKKAHALISDAENILIISHGEPLWLWAAYSKGAKTADEFLATRKVKENNLYPDTGDLIEL